MRISNSDQNREWKRFAEEFLSGRIRFLEKDIRICLRTYRSKRYTNNTSKRAYFPALITCCATLEFMAGLNIGNLKNQVPMDNINRYVKYYMHNPAYLGEAA